MAGASDAMKPERFVAASIIAKLPASWRDFATSLKHKREEISTEDLIIVLDVEEKARAKDMPSTSAVAENGANANSIEKKLYDKNKGKLQDGGKTKKTTNSKTREDGYLNKKVVNVTLTTAAMRPNLMGMGAWSSSVLVGNGSATSILGVGTVELKLNLGKIVHLKNVQHAPIINRNFISGSLL
ncbi:uncharacterized protein LOC133910487 [Phragmites australis]|uniref:uncharacterized protein LOC133910487 n=1 Tax=Phragmites australis TaxID=29695 RepID=UPI002D7763E2|nr:uncharacterized protein LOC133910487 [Phragmites australis]